MQISIKTLCDWPIYLTASADEKTGLHYADFPSLHYIVYESISCKHGTKLNYCQLCSYTHHRATYLSLPPYLSYYNWTLPSFFLYSSSNLFASNPDFHFTILSPQLSSLSAIKIKSSAYSNSRGKPAHSSLEIISITITNSRGLNTDPWCNPTFH